MKKIAIASIIAVSALGLTACDPKPAADNVTAIDNEADANLVAPADENVTDTADLDNATANEAAPVAATNAN
jgi:hypothetical protein